MKKIGRCIFGKSMKTGFKYFKPFFEEIFVCDICGQIKVLDHNTYCDIECLKNKIEYKHDQIKDSQNTLLENIKKTIQNK